ncbi:MAG: glutamate racemase [Clostridia bacterium]
MINSPIGVFDSGLGGASVLKEALLMLPTENYIYYGDNLNAPYGDKNEEEITALTSHCAEYLVKRGVKAILLACNTATATCIHQIRKSTGVPVISIEPAIKPACAQPGNGKILMMATLATTRLERYLDLKRRMPDPERVINVPCPGLVNRIEQGIFACDAFDDLLDAFIGGFTGQQIDGIVLGCTHYVFIKDAIARYARRNFAGNHTLYDGNSATVHQLGHVLDELGIANPSGDASVEFHTSGKYSIYKPLFDMLLKS